MPAYFIRVEAAPNVAGFAFPCSGTGQVRWDEAFKAIRGTGYDGWFVIEAFGRALPDLAAATRVWRDLFPSPEEVYTKGIAFIREKWAAAK